MKRFIMFAALMTVAAAAAADGFSYNHANAGYGRLDVDDIDVDGDLLGASLSFEVSDSFFVFGDYGRGDLDGDFGVNVDFSRLGLGIGHHLPIADRLDLVSKVSWEWAEIEVPFFGDEDDTGYGLGLGLRYAATPQLELNGGLSYVNFGGGADDTGVDLGGLYNFTDRFAVGLSTSFTDDTTSYGIGGRFYFGK